MPRRTSNSRTRRRRATNRAAQPASQRQETTGHPTVPLSGAVATEPRRPARVPASRSTEVSADQIQRETVFIRKDLVRMIITMAVVIAFMVVAEIVLD